MRMKELLFRVDDILWGDFMTYLLVAVGLYLTIKFGGQKMGVNSIDAEEDQFAYRYDTQLLIDRRDKDLDEDEIADYITENFEGNSLIAAGDEDLVKIHFHTNEPWKLLEYCNSVGEIYDIVVEDMIRQSAGLQG